MKKILITESQMKSLLYEERLTLVLQESIEEAGSVDSLRVKIKNLLLAGVSAAAIISSIGNLKLPFNEKKSLIDTVHEEMVDTTGFAQKVKDVESYMKFALSNQGYSMKSTRLKPETLVRASMETGFDLPFLMAAAHQESCFGATPRAQRTNSVFSVGSYDNGKNAVTYADPNDSVADYIDLLNRRYLVDGKTISDLMTPGEFVNDDGKRYASDKGYEGKIKYLRNLILKKYPDLS